MEGAVGYDAGYLIRLLFKWWIIGSSVMWAVVGTIYGVLRYMTDRIAQQ